MFDDENSRGWLEKLDWFQIFYKNFDKNYYYNIFTYVSAMQLQKTESYPAVRQITLEECKR